MDHGSSTVGSCGNGSAKSKKVSNGGAKSCGDPAAANTNCCSTDEDEHAKLLAEMKAKLTPMELMVTQDKVTERPFSNRYNRHFEPGSYHCVVCNTELFKSETKFESKSGWPAFYNVVDEKRIKLKADTSHVGGNILLLISRPDLARNEVSCAFCKSHLGHLFQDGPKPTGLRYCVNSNSLKFYPKPDSEVTAEESQMNNNKNGNATSGPETQFITCNLNATEQTDCSDTNLLGLGENVPSGKLCINVSNGNGTCNGEKRSSVPRRDSRESAPVLTSTASKGTFCIFTQCLPKESKSTSSPDTSPSTQKHYYKPSGTNNVKSVTENNAAVIVNSTSALEPKSSKLEGMTAAPKKKVKARAPPPPTLNLNKDGEKSHDQDAVVTIRRFGTDVPSPTGEVIETVTRRPSNGVLRETFL